MTASIVSDRPVERIRQNLVALRMPRALETLDGVVGQLERGLVSAIEPIDTLLAEQITVREDRRIKAALQVARLSTNKALTGFDFSFQPPLDRTRIAALASLEFINRPRWSTSSPVRHGKVAPGHRTRRQGYPGRAQHLLLASGRPDRQPGSAPTARGACANASAVSAAASSRSSTRPAT